VWWWPDTFGLCFWPAGVNRNETAKSFLEAFRSLGYQPCEDGSFESGFEKVAIFVKSNERPTHAARQLEDGTWTSKLGKQVDIKHETVEALNGDQYGKADIFLKRRRRNNDLDS
jgi:hypothetical protein